MICRSCWNRSRVDTVADAWTAVPVGGVNAAAHGESFGLTPSGTGSMPYQIAPVAHCKHPWPTVPIADLPTAPAPQPPKIDQDTAHTAGQASVVTSIPASACVPDADAWECEMPPLTSPRDCRPTQESRPNRESQPAACIAQDGVPSLDGRSSHSQSVGIHPSSVHTPETSSGGSSIPSDPSAEYLQACAVHQSFRHSFWSTRREATVLALRTAMVTQDEMDRFATCGSETWLQQAANVPGKCRLVCNRCRNRWCEACAGERRRLVTQNVAAACRDMELRFLTLTLKHSDAPLRDQLDRLYESFRKLRARRFWAKHVLGGMSFVEVKWMPQTKEWHPHLHCLLQGKFLPHELVKTAWLEITGDSYIVDIRYIANVETACGYVAKYTTKGIDGRIWRDVQLYAGVIQAMRGRRMFATFGTWSGLNLSKPPESDIEWVTIGTLNSILARAQNGDAVAIQLLSQLRGTQDADVVDAPTPDNPDP